MPRSATPSHPSHHTRNSQQSDAGGNHPVSEPGRLIFKAKRLDAMMAGCQKRLRAGQEMKTMAYLAHDAIAGGGVVRAPKLRTRCRGWGFGGDLRSTVRVY
jgi:hypothetical protein